MRIKKIGPVTELSGRSGVTRGVASLGAKELTGRRKRAQDDGNVVSSRGGRGCRSIDCEGVK